METKEKIVGIDIGGTNFRIGTVSRDGDLSDFKKVPVGSVFCSNDAMKDLAGYLKEYCEKAVQSGADIKAVCIGFPATLDRDRKTVLPAPNIAFMENLPVTEVLTKELNLPVFIERDVTLALCYDKKKYQLPDTGVISGFYFGTGVGNAIFINGRPLIGKNGTAGELGHIPVEGSDLVCGCGNVGCLENLAGGKYLAQLQAETFPETPIGRMFSEHGNEPVLREFIDHMAMAAATEINILNPDFNLIGGGLPSMKDFPKDLLVERILFHTRKPYPAEDLDILFTGDIPEKCVIGAALFAFSKLTEQ